METQRIRAMVQIPVHSLLLVISCWVPDNQQPAISNQQQPIVQFPYQLKMDE